MNIFQKIKVLFQMKELVNLIKGGKIMQLLKTWAGVIKVVTYVAALVGLLMGYLPEVLVIKVILIISAVVKIAEIIIGLTPSKVDDERLAEIIKILKDKGIIKI